jgi:hypothetical protein
MVDDCVTGKVCYQTRVEAIQALIKNWIEKNHRVGMGPINVYECLDCGNWHFTSKGMKATELIENLESGRIEKERKMFGWKSDF